MYRCCAQATARWAAQTIANLPGIVGFYPQDSLILIGWDQSESAADAVYSAHQGKTPVSHGTTPALPTTHRPQLNQQFEGEGYLRSGPIIRVDVADEPAFDDALQFLREIGCDLVSLLAITPDSGIPAHVTAALEDVSNDTLNIVALWHVPEICHTAPITALYVQEAAIAALIPHDHQGASKMSPGCQIGQVADITGSASLRRLAALGELPALSRAEATAFVDALPPGDSDRTLDLVRTAAELAQLVQENPVVARAVFEPLSRLLRQSPHTVGSDLVQVPLQNLAQTAAETPWRGFNAGLAEQLGSFTNQEYVALWLASTTLRDICLKEFVYPEHYGPDWCLGVAHDFSSLIRANALSIYSLIVMNSALSYRCRPALLAAQEALPGHSLSLLIVRGYDCGKGMVMRKGALRGSTEAQEMILAAVER